MVDSHLFAPLLWTLPPMTMLACILHFAHASAPAQRQHALALACTICLLCTLWVMAPWSATGMALPAEIIHLSMLILAAHMIAGSLLDRARFMSLAIAAVMAAVILTSLLMAEIPMLLPLIPRTAFILLLIVASSVMGLIGSMLTRPHPARITAQGARRITMESAHWQSVGMVLLTFVMLMLALLLSTADMTLQDPITSAMIAGLLSLVWARHVHHLHPLRCMSEGILAGMLVGLLGAASLSTMIIASAMAAFCVVHGPAMAHALRIDDPAHHLGVLLLPALAGLLLPTLASFAMLADHLRWLGAAIACAIVTALIVWPLTMAIFGLAARPPQR